jgi:hypothetical protein
MPETRAIDFTFEKDRIIVAGEREIIFTATITFTNQGRCKIKVGDQELEQWQVLKMALEDLFFSPVKP